jgi:hypothetical protein
MLKLNKLVHLCSFNTIVERSCNILVFLKAQEDNTNKDYARLNTNNGTPFGDFLRPHHTHRVSGTG